MQRIPQDGIRKVLVVLDEASERALLLLHVRSLARPALEVMESCDVLRRLGAVQKPAGRRVGLRFRHLPPTTTDAYRASERPETAWRRLEATKRLAESGRLRVSLSIKANPTPQLQTPNAKELLVFAGRSLP